MNDCLLTTLKASVSADIYKLNEIRMFIPAGNVMRIKPNDTYVSGMVFTITPLSGSFSVGATTYTSESPLQVDGTTDYRLNFPADADAVISISNKMAIKGFYFDSGNRVSSVSGKHRAILNPEFGYMPNLTTIEAYMSYDAGGLGRFNTLTRLGTGNYYQMFSPYVWRNFVNAVNFPILDRLVCASNDQTDQVNIKVFSTLITLTQFRATNDIGFIGALEDLAQGMVDAGRTSGTMYANVNNIITYNGSPCDNTKTYTITFANGGYTIAHN